MNKFKLFFAFDPKDTEEIRLEKFAAFLVAGFTTIAGIIWTALYYFVFGWGLSSQLTASFSIIVGGALLISHISKNHRYAIYAQIICVIYITTFVQWSIGGVFDSGIVLIWAFLGPMVALMFLSVRQSIFWFLLYIINLVITVFYNDFFVSIGQEVTEPTKLIFFIMNLSFATTIVFIFANYYVNAAVREQKKANKLLDTNLQQEIALRQSEKMASLGMLVAGVAHEINTPLGAVTSMHDTLIRGVNKMKAFVASSSASKTTTEDNVQKTIDIIDDANEVINSGNARIKQIVKQLKSFARLDEAELQSVDVNECIEETIRLFEHELKDKIILKKNFSDLPEIVCYPAKLNQVFLNLLVNANQAIDGKGEISIDTFTEDENICITITDNGKGIPKKSFDKIFDPGFTAKGVGVGTGLGLSISYRIIQEHKGDISVESKEGEGSIFKITLPTDLISKLKET